jgi:hypothetical protein
MTPVAAGHSGSTDAHRLTRAVQREIELWRVVKDTRELRCISRYLPTGIDLRPLEGEDFRRPQLLRAAETEHPCQPRGGSVTCWGTGSGCLRAALIPRHNPPA